MLREPGSEPGEVALEQAVELTRRQHTQPLEGLDLGDALLALLGLQPGAGGDAADGRQREPAGGAGV